SYLGNACTTDFDCGPLVCATTVPSSLAGGGPQGGLCTKGCLAHEDCPPNGLCYDFGDGTGHCVQQCTLGAAVSRADKCRARNDVACVPLDAATMVSGCLPVCTSNKDCGDGLYCNYGTGLCQTSKPVGDPMGSPCNPKANTCAGICTCTDTSCASGFCSGIC